MRDLLNSQEAHLTDNSKIEYCKQCKNCINWDPNGSPFGNQYDKAFCNMYAYPDGKPPGIINNIENCDYREEK